MTTSKQWMTKPWAVSLAILASTSAIRCGNNEANKKNQEDVDQATLSEHWDQYNDPQRIGLRHADYVMDFTKLPKEGQLAQIPWSGSYWPNMRGGISYRWAEHHKSPQYRMYYDLIPYDSLTNPGIDLKILSPAEKFDIFVGDKDYSLTNAERKRTNVFSQRNSSYKIPYWYGLCHAWAPATLMYSNPGPVTVKNKDGILVPFGSSDIKALLSMYLHEVSSPSYMVSLRCNTDDKELRRRLQNHEISLEDYNKAMDSAECQGINPGAFHVLLGNMIGIRKEGFLADVTRGAEVWNQSVSGFKSRVVRNRTEISPQAAIGTTLEVLIETVMIYTIEITDTWDRVQIPESNKEVVYKYWLELDASMNIIGGSWLSDQRPDFLWRRERPTPEFAGKWAPLKELLEKSTKDLVSFDSSNESDSTFGSNAENHGNEYLVHSPKWHFSKFMFTYLVDVELTAQPGVASVVMEVVKHNGKTYKHKRLKARGHVFHLRNYPISQWKAGGLRLIGKDKNGKQIFSTFKTFSN